MRKLSIGVAIYALSFCAFSQDAITTWENLKNHYLPDVPMGLQITDAKTGKSLFEHQAYSSFRPASTTKVFLSYAALKSLGPDYRFKTNLSYEDNIHGEVLNSDVAISFFGDPSLSTSELKSLLAKLNDLNIKRIQGNLILDETAFSGSEYAVGRPWEDRHWYFHPPVNAMNLDENKLTIKLIPARTMDAQANITKLSDLPVHIDHNVNTVSPKQSDLCSFDIEQQGLEYHLGGCWPLRETSSTLHLSNRFVQTLAQKITLDALDEMGIELQGSLIFAGHDLPTQHTHFSKPMIELIQTMLLYSNNLYADAILKTLGYEQFNDGSFSKGLKVMMDALTQAGFDVTKLAFRDGSGGSEYNLVSAAQLNRLLFLVYQDSKIRAVFEKALPIASKRGSLKPRFHSIDLSEKVMGKTGTLTGHSALTSYLTIEDKTLIVTLLINNSINTSTAHKIFEEKVMQWARSEFG